MRKTKFENLREFEQTLRDEFGMVDWKLVFDDTQFKYLVVFCSNGESRIAKVDSKQGQLYFNFDITENGVTRKIHYSFPRMLLIWDSPCCRTSGLVMDCTDNNSSNNAPLNLQAISQRLNIIKHKNTVIPIPTKYSVEYCRKRLGGHENSYQRQLKKQLKMNSNGETDPKAEWRLDRTYSNVSYWTGKLAYAIIGNLYESEEISE